MRSFLVVSVLAIFIFLSVAATAPGNAHAGAFTNLKVLPADISDKALSAIMVDEFQDDLGVSCNFCHAENADTHKPDYASDEKPEKLIARQMMKMTLRLNKKYFSVSRPVIGDSVSVVTCNTCHKGNPVPEK